MITLFLRGKLFPTASSLAEVSVPRQPLNTYTGLKIFIRYAGNILEYQDYLLPFQLLTC